MNKVHILTGNIHSGKTTKLLELSQGNTRIGGFCSPKKEGTRWLYFLSNGKEFSMEEIENESETIAVGKYIFNKSVFQTAINQFENDLKNPRLKFLIIDELGPIELRKEGFYSLLEILFPYFIDKEFLIVIRSTLLKDFQIVFSRFKFQTQIWTIENIDNLFMELFENE